MHSVIAHSVDPFAPAEGGSARYARNLVKVLLERDIEMTVLGVQRTKRDRDQAPFSFVPVLRGSDHWFRYLIKLFEKVIALDIPNSAIVQTLRLDYMLPFVLMKPQNPKILVSDQPLVGWAQLVFPRLIFPPFATVYHAVEAYCLRRIDLLITDIKTREYFLKRYPWMKAKLVTMPTSFIDLGLFRPHNKASVRASYGFDDEDKLIMFVGRIAPQKNIEFLVRAFGILKGKLPRAKLVIVGRGEGVKLERYVVERGLRDVVFTGEIHPNIIPEILSCADVLALTSVMEGSPTVAKEALACGVPVVSTDTGDIKTLVTGEPLGAVVTGDETRFAEALVEVLGWPAQRPNEVRAACVKAAKPYGLEALADGTIEAYEIALERRGFGARDGSSKDTESQLMSDQELMC